MKFHKKTKLHEIPWTFVKYREIVFPTFVHFHKSCRNSANIRLLDKIWQFFHVILTIFTSNISAFYRIEWEIMRFYKRLWKLMKAMIIHNISRSKHSLLFRFVQLQNTIGISCPLQTRFFCLLLYCFTFRQTSANILPLSNERWFFQYPRYLQWHSSSDAPMVCTVNR